MAKKDKASLDENISYYEAYFKEELDAIDEELEKSKEYSAIIDTEIQKLSAPALGANKGGQHYLIEHIANAVQLQTQRQGLRRDKFAIKKAIIDYGAKFADDTEGSSSEEMFEALERMLKEKTANIKEQESSIQPDNDLDNEIDARLQ